ncbi:MAG: aminotransferase class V-fold PLP-dependent enzyme [Candidatus Marinimicrobia bacterium]|nr:aminotransferase class V-fold PLP-dependent enzyme [Candidatus Neomarinimicrobiota bacterium]MCF7829597.1 aminotransferase class V-fold PLP-dependent enzyme [Candidatus Neomarinimicrobiota bacterium]MCF7882251.1 aminotransferase class V-fold PLP-dependent enzyme [Candidatus Neomarinimicrobiota bacterium]
MSGYDQLYREFVSRFPDYGNTAELDDLREQEFQRLDQNGQIYLDYTGGSLYAKSQLNSHTELLTDNVFGNPHSNNPTSRQMTDVVEEARARVLEYFCASPDEYTAIFTLNASGALKLVGEAFPFQRESRFLLTVDNHNSVNGIRVFARDKGAEVKYIPVAMPDLRMDDEGLEDSLDNCDRSVPNLLAYPAQSNFTGVQHSMDWIPQAQDAGCHVLLDAAAYVPTNTLDLSAVQPDFVALSFYKMFGYPTGIGCLIAKKKALGILRRPWFAGGTIALASVHSMNHQLADDEAGFEDGTVDYLNIPAVKFGLDLLESVSIESIHRRVQSLTGWLLATLMELRHSNGNPMVRVYGPTTTEARGGNVAFNIYDPDGSLIDFRRVEELANTRQISLRTGCFCNPGVIEVAEGLTAKEMEAGFANRDKVNYPHFLSVLEHQEGKSAGAVRVSFGLVSNFKDAYHLVEFLKTFRDQTTGKIGRVSFDIQTCRRLRDGS